MMIVTSLVMLITTTVRADKTKKIVLIQDCDAYNAMLVSQNGIPGYPPGNYVAGDQCVGTGPICIYCDDDNADNFTILSNQPPQQVGMGQPHNNSCGSLYVGRCTQTGSPDDIASQSHE